MLGVLRRKVASGTASAPTLGKSLRRIQPGAVTPRVCCAAREEIFIHPRGCYQAQNFCQLVLDAGHLMDMRPQRLVIQIHSLLRGVMTNVHQSGTLQNWSRPYCSSGGDLVDAVVPYMGESISDGTLATFLKKPGDRVEVDEAIAQVETDKVTIDVTSPEAGIIQEFVAKEGDTVEPGTKVAVISKSGEGVNHVAPSEKAAPQPSDPVEQKEKPKTKVEAPPVKEKPKEASPPPPKTSATEPQLPPKERERRVPMTRLRKRVATRLKDSQNTFALLTTFNEVDMTNLMKLRSEYKDAFVEKHGVKLGLMSGFIKAAVSALQNQPVVNAVIDGDDIIYRDYIDISIAVGTPKGLVVPVIREADKMNFAEIEKTMNTLAKKANNGTISIDEMAGGSFTISNGGVYGSLLSTPIINPPQSAILGMHSIVNRPMVVGGNIVPRPMMYIALTYDHRLIDGREAVYFLRRIKDVVEDPRRLLLDV
ncbi:PREDICTED: dihydrolipoyllysine-residue succinyltransferase component of 2-oxoglutarate dehydrogenase complex 2, mitochondrial-like isoform X1 [Ipomoea nil]|uniref:dihydrolipoyllysine-residue succinyltransferase component of 2-oxoglutarate dehydrogenase complex 2, mitochondrial-like isoform X1 n=1 Tax=Ipomoea nil TaxID=35883 RepID=UPI000901F701|nr:PREDICTED: dihydrolipoyllysine-residue succinyltransferase component of 2-oxoglutarate dehydrogenase complex 2, mitochondrial-like isoform X1 [Ipomoea nil]